ncbi:MAG: superoxide dismutase [Nitrospinae bacterium]|nr:superoxide dismutase [Nitrospinota bacterium]|tara:strand:+ start:457 stop:1053 length:597 start_codon:yes stop_codon:yes gene_type:complete
MAFELPNLDYDYAALEPNLDARTMEIHHTKHHNTYTTNLNNVSAGTDLEGKSIEEILSNIDSVPEDIRGAVNFNGGGYDNHCIFWKNMSPNGGGAPSGDLASAIGDFDKFKDDFSKSATGVQGSGWCWLVTKSGSGSVEIKTMPNQTSPRTEGFVPLLGIDVWEHAYYLNYQNRRPDYIAAWWNVVNWEDVASRFASA